MQEKFLLVPAKVSVTNFKICFSVCLGHRVKKGFSVRRGPTYAPKRKKVATDLTRDMLQRYVYAYMKFSS